MYVDETLQVASYIRVSCKFAKDAYLLLQGYYYCHLALVLSNCPTTESKQNNGPAEKNQTFWADERKVFKPLEKNCHWVLEHMFFLKPDSSYSREYTTT